jgi:hypothetical protein
LTKIQNIDDKLSQDHREAATLHSDTDGGTVTEGDVAIPNKTTYVFTHDPAITLLGI